MCREYLPLICQNVSQQGIHGAPFEPLSFFGQAPSRTMTHLVINTLRKSPEQNIIFIKMAHVFYLSQCLKSVPHSRFTREDVGPKGSTPALQSTHPPASSILAHCSELNQNWNSDTSKCLLLHTTTLTTTHQDVVSHPAFISHPPFAHPSIIQPETKLSQKRESRVLAPSWIAW
jgi:hypothetical protein